MIELTYRLARRKEEAERITRELVLPQVQAIDQQGEMPLEVMAALWEAGFLSLSVPRKWGGEGASLLEQTLVIEWLSRGSASVGQQVLIQCLGLCPLLQFGTEEQKERLSREVVNGRRLAAFALSEPDSENNNEQVRETRARRQEDDYVLNGCKALVSAAELADLITVFAVTDSQKGLKTGLSAFVVPKGTFGMTAHEPMERAGLRGVPVMKLAFEECRIPVHQLLGQEGQGYEISQYALTATSPLAAGQAVGLAEAAFQLARDRIKRRDPRLEMASESQPLEISLAEMSTRLAAARALTYSAARAWDQGKPEAWLLSRQAKVFATDTAAWVTDQALQCLGAGGLSRGHPLEIMMRDARTMQVQLAANNVHKINIARALLGSRPPHEEQPRAQEEEAE